MWKCSYMFHVTNKKLPYVGLFVNTETKESRVVRLLDIQEALNYEGEDTAKFTRIDGVRPEKVFRTVFISEGDPSFSLKIVDPSVQDVPDLDMDQLRQELSDD